MTTHTLAHRRKQKMKRTTILLAAMLLALPLLTTACFESDADVAAKNISKAAEQFAEDAIAARAAGEADRGR